MTVYVDSAVHAWRGRMWCHMFCPDMEELHAFARRIGLQRSWFQDPSTMPKVSWPHYDTVAARRLRAIDAGAVPLDRHRTAIMSKVVINAWRGRTPETGAIDPLAMHRRLASPRLPELRDWLLSVHPEYGRIAE